MFDKIQNIKSSMFKCAKFNVSKTMLLCLLGGSSEAIIEVLHTNGIKLMFSYYLWLHDDFNNYINFSLHKSFVYIYISIIDILR